MRFAEYETVLENEKNTTEIESAIQTILSLSELPWRHQRDNRTRDYDLRQLIDDIWLIEVQGSGCTLGIRLQCSSKGAGRPEQVTTALGWKSMPRTIHRTRLILA